MLYEYKCMKCGFSDEYWYRYNNVSTPLHCGKEMDRVYTPPVVRPNGIMRDPPGQVCMGTERPNPKKVDHMDGVEREMYHAVEQNEEYRELRV